MKVDWIPVGDVLNLQRRSVALELEERYVEIGVRSFARGLFKKQPTAASDIGNKRVFRIEPGDLVVSNVFAWEGAVAVADERHQGTIGSHRFMTWTPLTERVSTDFLAHYFASERGLESLRKASPGSAGRNRTLSIKNFEGINVPVPVRADQHRIAAHLDRLSNLRPVRVGSRAGDLVASVLDALDWTSTMSDLVSPAQQETAVDPTARYRLMGVYGGGRGAIDRGLLLGGATSYKTMNRVGAGQVVFSRLKAFEGAVTVVPDALDGAVASKEFPVCSVLDGVPEAFVAAVIRSPRFVAGMASRSAGIGARRERLSLAGFLQVPVPRASPETQERIGRLHQRREALERLAHRANALNAALLPAARNEIFSAMR